MAKLEPEKSSEDHSDNGNRGGNNAPIQLQNVVVSVDLQPRVMVLQENESGLIRVARQQNESGLIRVAQVDNEQAESTVNEEFSYDPQTPADLESNESSSYDQSESV